MFYPGDVVQTKAEKYLLLEVMYEKGEYVHCQYTSLIGKEYEPHTSQVTFRAEHLAHVGVVRPLYKEPTDDNEI